MAAIPPDEEPLPRKQLKVCQKWAIVTYYNERVPQNWNQLPPGTLQELTNRFQVTSRTIQRVVEQYRDELYHGHIFANL